ncbi:MAG: TVP38/TMEM64 family protein [Methylococcaceae bacterium]|nr:TVP38/TMEM64 family protein [Methylococcaceae bacterium]
MIVSRSQLLIAIGLLFALFFYFDWDDHFTLANLQARQDAIVSYYVNYPTRTLLIYGLIYIVVTGLSLPGATILTLAGGALFGLFWGTVIVSFASSIGATLAFLAARYLFRESVERKFGAQLAKINEGILKDGAYYLFTLRLVPLIPFFGINLLMGLTGMKTSTYYWVSQIGMLAGTLVYVNAGTQLAGIKSLSDITSPFLIGSFILLGLFPLAAKKLVERRALDKTIDKP